MSLSRIHRRNRSILSLAAVASLSFALAFPGVAHASTDEPSPTDVTAIAAKKSVSSWKDVRNRSIVLREGNYSSATGKGFGWTKIKQRHAITKYNTVKFPTLNPDGGVSQGTQRIYKAWAIKWEKRNKRWVAVDQREVRTVVETKRFATYYGARLDAAPGVLTTYCINPDKALKCPKWVDTALANGNKKISSSTLDAIAGSSPVEGDTAMTGSFSEVTVGQTAPLPEFDAISSFGVAEEDSFLDEELSPTSDDPIELE